MRARIALSTALLVSIVFGIAAPPRAEADPMRDFIVSCSYGVLAGTLVGAATLAFSDKPGENLNKVARGASLGLYAGILLGAYVVFGVPGEDEEAAAALRGTDLRPLPSLPLAKREPPPMVVYPLLGDRGVEGAAASFNVYRF